MSNTGTFSRSNVNPSVNPSSSNNNVPFDNFDIHKQNNQNLNDNIIDENDENEENEDEEYGESIEEEQEDNEQNEENKDKSQELKNQGEEGQGRLERIFIYLRSGFSWRPIPTIRSTVLCLEITGAIFLAIGIIIFIFSSKIKQIEIRYDNNKDCEIGKQCNINFTLTKDMKKDVFI
jgi:hypothetical protein